MDGRLEDNREGRGRGGTALTRSPGANDANLPCKSRHISRHRAAEGCSRASRFRYPFSPVVLAPFSLPFPLPPFPTPLSFSLSLSNTSAQQHSADMPEVDEKFSELLSRELSRRAPTTSRKFCDVNAIARRTAEDPLAGFAYLLARASREFIGHRFANRQSSVGTVEISTARRIITSWRLCAFNSPPKRGKKSNNFAYISVSVRAISGVQFLASPGK